MSSKNHLWGHLTMNYSNSTPPKKKNQIKSNNRNPQITIEIKINAKFDILFSFTKTKTLMIQLLGPMTEETLENKKIKKIRVKELRFGDIQLISESSKSSSKELKKSA